MVNIASGYGEATNTSDPIDLVLDKVELDTTDDAPPPPTGATLLVDFGDSEATNSYELTDWETTDIDKYSDYVDEAVDGVKGGTNPNYMYANVSGTSHPFNLNDMVTVTWYNNSSSAITFDPHISFDDPDRRVSGAGGSWYPMDPVTIDAGQSGSGTYTVTSATAGMHLLVNINSNYGEANNQTTPVDLILDKIELGGSGGSTTDTTPPATPGNLTAALASPSQIDISWSASFDMQSGIAEYVIYRDGVNWDTTTNTSYSDTGLASGTTYTYNVSAVNGDGVEGGQSNNASATNTSALPHNLILDKIELIAN